ncbi:MAG: tRNA (guanine(46)-N(7))-methyltransferase TrmB [Hyphomicrobiaceae bacterium]|nr:tRNA (guanosine(46)-N7)-methyltransferase TrmB [Hyphomicrobiaceae bacterium]
MRSELRSFGRRRGRKLSALQDGLLRDLLPRLALDLKKPAPADATQLFDAPVREVWLEIGFGGGEHLVWQARANADVGLIGCEPFLDGVVKVLTQIDRDGLKTVRLHADDARDVLRWLPDASIARAFVLYPDPWPKRKHLKRRLVNGALLDGLARVMKPGGELRVGTDIADYARTMLMAFQGEPRFRWTAEGPDDWRIRPSDWPQTRYEDKAVREGRRSCYLLFERV